PADDTPPSAAPPSDADPDERPQSAPQAAAPQATPRTPSPAGPPAAKPPGATAPAGVTEWAVAAIPGGGEESPAPVAQLAVDEETEDAASVPAGVRVATLAPPQEGEVLADAAEAPVDDADDSDVDVLGPAAAASRPPAAPSRANAGVQRYGEPVVRQLLDARFVREEPYDPPTRFG
ncbi:MAG: DNA polymerase III subunit gamma and tau, partial [Microbacterium sp.]